MGIPFDICCITFGDYEPFSVWGAPNCSSRLTAPPCAPSVCDVPTPAASNTCCRIDRISEAENPCCHHLYHPETDFRVPLFYDLLS